MTPFESVAMLEKLALLKIARCRAPAFRSTSSACSREFTSLRLSPTLTRVCVVFLLPAMVLPQVTDIRRRGLRWRSRSDHAARVIEDQSGRSIVAHLGACHAPMGTT